MIRLRRLIWRPESPFTVKADKVESVLISLSYGDLRWCLDLKEPYFSLREYWRVPNIPVVRIATICFRRLGAYLIWRPEMSRPQRALLFTNRVRWNANWELLHMVLSSLETEYC